MRGTALELRTCEADCRKLGIMQPYFFPYIGYFSLIDYCDEFIFFDTPQYISHGWVNRNRILKQGGKPSYITVPIVKAPRETAIKDIQISNQINWRERIFGQLAFYKKRAPYYRQVLGVIHEIIDREYTSLSQLDIECTIRICRELGITTKFATFSAMHLPIDQVTAPDEWALNITKALGYKIYVNPPGGMTFFHREKYAQAEIELQFLKAELVPYVQRIGHFEPGLSIIDVMMYNSLEEIQALLHQYTIMS